MNLAHDEKDAKGEREFIAWVDSQGLYTATLVALARQAWQAARADTARVVAEAVAGEREACAVLCETDGWVQHLKPSLVPTIACAAAIRARSAQPDAREKP